MESCGARRYRRRDEFSEVIWFTLHVNQLPPAGGVMSVDLNRVIEQVSKEKGIDKTIVVNAVEEMMHSAARRTFGPDRNIESRFNAEIGEIELFEIKTVVATVANAGSEVELE